MSQLYIYWYVCHGRAIEVGSDQENQFKSDLKSNQNHFWNYDLNQIKIISEKNDWNQNQNHEKIDCNQFQSLTLKAIF